MRFTVQFRNSSGAPITGLTVYISIWQVTDADVVTNPVTMVSNTAMTEMGEGFYHYPYPSANDAYDYTALADGGAALAALRYADCISTVQGTTEATLDDTSDLQTNQGNWLTATGFSTHTAADVWAVTTRTLTSIADLLSDIWTYATRSINSGTVTTDTASRDASKANVSALSTQATQDLIQADTTQIITDVLAVKGVVDLIRTDTINIAWDDITFIKAVAGGDQEVAGTVLIFSNASHTEVARFNLDLDVDNNPTKRTRT